MGRNSIIWVALVPRGSTLLRQIFILGLLLCLCSLQPAFAISRDILRDCPDVGPCCPIGNAGITITIDHDDWMACVIQCNPCSPCPVHDAEPRSLSGCLP